jgi:hypothetical protein
MHASSVAGREIFVSHNSGRVSRLAFNYQLVNRLICVNYSCIGGDVAVCGNRNVSRHAVDIRDLVDEWHWHCLILYCVAFRDLEESWIGFSAIKLCDFGSPGARTWIAVYQ